MRKAVLFDMDGVITDTERFYVDGMLDLLKKNGIHLEPTDLQEFFGSPLLHNCTVLQARYHLAKTPQECMDEVVTYRDQQIQIGGLQPMDGVLELIRELHDADVKMAVASSSTMDNIVHNMETLGIKGCFKALVSGAECEHGKPAPDVYLKAAKEISMKPEECVVIEDAYNGVIAAKTAGMYCHAYVPPQAYRQDVSLADDVITSYRDVTVEDVLANN